MLNSSLMGANFAGATLAGVDFRNANMVGANLNGAQASGAAASSRVDMPATARFDNARFGEQFIMVNFYRGFGVGETDVGSGLYLNILRTTPLDLAIFFAPFFGMLRSVAEALSNAH
jgi:uncharacterized protein YjbI with pentapeptide repeats